jgi:predicted regulator of Ras-like GTPase activity (Roadblock/LC7/MglB family)
MSLQTLVEPLQRARGVRGALVVSREDGLVVSSALHEGVNGPAVAALSASLCRRIDTLTRALGQPVPMVFELSGSEGSLLAAPARSGLLVVAVTSRDADREAVRHELAELAKEVD